MADEQSVGLTTSMPMSAPPAPTPPTPPAGAMDKGVTGADPASDPANSLMAEAVRLGGPLGGVAIGAATGAAHHVESQNQPSVNRRDPVQVRQDPKFLGLDPQSKYDVLMSIDPKFAALSEADRQSVVGHLSQSGMGAALLSNPEDIGTGPEGTIGTDQLMSQASQADASKKGGILAGTMAGALAAPAAAAAVGGTGIAGSMAAGAAQGGASSVVQSLAEGENPFRLEMWKQAAEQAAIGAGTGAVLHGAVKGAGAIADKFTTPSAAEAVVPSVVNEGHFTSIPDEDMPRLAGGKSPFIGEQPFDNSTIAAMRQGRTLNTETANLLRQYAGDTIPAGSHELNTAMRAVGPVNENINRLGLELQRLVQGGDIEGMGGTGPINFAQSAIEDETIGTPLREDLQTMKETLPGGASNPKSEIITKELAASNKALVATDPQELLMERRKLGGKIDWDNVLKNPDTDREVQNTARARIYGALTDKLKQIEGVAKIDDELQPNLELRGWLDKVLPEGVSRDPVEAEAQRISEFRKGQKINAIKAHNERVAQNVATAKKAIGAAALVGTAVGGGLVGHAIRGAGTAAATP